MKFTLTGSCRLSIKEEVMPPDSGTTSYFAFLENQQDTLWVLLELYCHIKSNRKRMWLSVGCPN